MDSLMLHCLAHAVPEHPCMPPTVKQRQRPGLLITMQVLNLVKVPDCTPPPRQTSGKRKREEEEAAEAGPLPRRQPGMQADDAAGNAVSPSEAQLAGVVSWCRERIAWEQLSLHLQVSSSLCDCSKTGDLWLLPLRPLGPVSNGIRRARGGCCSACMSRCAVVGVPYAIPSLFTSVAC